MASFSALSRLPGALRGPVAANSYPRPGRQSSLSSLAMPKVTLPGGDIKEIAAGSPVGEVLPGDAVCARVDGRLVDLSWPVDEDAAAEPVMASDPDGLRVLRHSTAHVMAQAVCDLFPGAKYAIGPPIEDGFYYDVELPQALTPDELPRLGAFKLLKLAGAYWRGDESRPMLQRIYGTAWPNQHDLKAYLNRVEEAERRDHRKLGRQLDLFSFPEELGPGLAVWHPRGGIFRKQLEDYVRDLHLERGYDLVVTPHLARRVLWDTSGHTAKFIENMYPVMDDRQGNEYFVKPMNCPFHVLVYKSQVRSYRDLPMRLSELGTVYR